MCPYCVIILWDVRLFVRTCCLWCMVTWYSCLICYSNTPVPLIHPSLRRHSTGAKKIYILYGIFTSVSVRTCLGVYVGYIWTLTCIRWSMNQIWISDMKSNDFKISALTKSLMRNMFFLKMFYWTNTFYKINPFWYLRNIMQIWFKALKFYTIVDIFRCSLYSSSNVLPLRALY